MLQQSFLHIFGVAQNFWLNSEGYMAQKKGGVRPSPPGYDTVDPICNQKQNMIFFKKLSVSVVNFWAKFLVLMSIFIF